MDELKTIYCYKLNDETGEIKKIAITDYKKGQWSNSKTFYRFRRNGAITYAYDVDFDKFKNNHVYSFDADLDKARSIILEALDVKRTIAHNNYLKYTERKDKIEGWGY